MISVERLLSYGKLESEAPLDTPPGVESPPPFWPDQGAVHFHKMKYRYSKDTPYVLRGITFDIRPAEKVHTCLHILYTTVYLLKRGVYCT